MKQQADKQAIWKQRYTLPLVGWARVAHGDNSKAVVLSNKTSQDLQAYAVDMQNGRFTQITHRAGGMPPIEMAFSPDGAAIYFLDDSKGDEIGHLMRMPFAGGSLTDMTPDLPNYSLRGIGFSQDGQHIGLVVVTKAGYHLYLVDQREDGSFNPPRLIYQDKLEFWQAELSANGRFVGIISTRQTKTRLYSIVIFDADTGEELAELWDGAGNSVELTRFSPIMGDDRLLGMSSQSGRKRPFLWNPISQQRTDFNFPQLEGDVLAWDWSHNGRSLLLCHSHWAQQQLYTFDIHTETLHKLNHPTGVYDFSIGPFGTFAQFLSNGNITALYQSAAHPLQFVEMDGKSGHLLRTIIGPDSAIPGRPWQSIIFPSSDDTPIQGWLAVPEGDGPFPLILNMHGGPHYMKSAEFDPHAQSWLDHGFAFCSINFRGSTGFGAAFQSQIWGNLGHWELEDMVAARHYLVENGIARADAIFLNGGSYGGYLTLWGLARRPDLWAGGLASVAIADWVANYEDAADAMKGAFTMWHGGSLDEVRERYVNSSPTTYAENIAAPLLIVQGYNDTRTSPRQMEAFEAQMQALGKEIELIWFDAGHGGIGGQEAISFQEKRLAMVQKVLRRL